jgi:nitroreductase
MTGLIKFLTRIRTAQWILIAAGMICGAAAFAVGVADNVPGIVLVYVGLSCLAGAWVWNWPSARDFWTLLLISLVAFPVGVILHNLLFALGTLVSGNQILTGLLGFLNTIFFLLAVMAAGPTALVSLVGGIYTSWRGMSRLTLKNRSFRRFAESYRIKEKTLLKLVGLVRQSASGGNKQPLKFILSCTDQKNALIFPALSWAAYYSEWSGPVEGERPSAYIILLGDPDLAKSFQYDAGIASQSITLGATELGLGACLLSSIKRDVLREALAIPEQYEILLVIALGKPAEYVVLDDVDPEGDIKYWRDGNDVHHVPKRALESLILSL